MWWGYWGLENLALGEANRTLLIEELRRLGPAHTPQPAHRNHWCTRLDHEAAIFEALWDTDNITIQAFKNRLAALFGVDPSAITHEVQQKEFFELNSAAVTFSYGATDYIRVVFFGYGGNDFPTWRQSLDEAAAYKSLHLEEWD